MNIDLPFLKTLSPPLRQAILITGVCFLVAVALVVFAVVPQQKRLSAVQKEGEGLAATLATMQADVSATQQQRLKTLAVMAERDAFIASGVLQPLLGSYAMRGKSLLDPIAKQTGFVITSVKEMPLIPLRVPSPAPEQLYGRQLIEFTGQGSYTQITAFVTCTETSLPLATLSSITILGQNQMPESHRAIITFEWPVTGEKRPPPLIPPK